MARIRRRGSHAAERVQIRPARPREDGAAADEAARDSGADQPGADRAGAGSADPAQQRSLPPWALGDSAPGGFPPAQTWDVGVTGAAAREIDLPDGVAVDTDAPGNTRLNGTYSSNGNGTSSNGNGHGSYPGNGNGHGAAPGELRPYPGRPSGWLAPAADPDPRDQAPPASAASGGPLPGPSAWPGTPVPLSPSAWPGTPPAQPATPGGQPPAQVPSRRPSSARSLSSGPAAPAGLPNATPRTRRSGPPEQHFPPLSPPGTPPAAPPGARPAAAPPSARPARPPMNLPATSMPFTGQPVVDRPPIGHPPAGQPPAGYPPLVDQPPAGPPPVSDQPLADQPPPPALPPKKSAAGGRRSRLSPKRAVIAVIAIGLVAFGLVNASSPDPSVEPTVQAFLLAWEQGNYRQAATFTTGSPSTVTAELRIAYRQLAAADITLQMGPITQHGDNGEAHFFASIDLGRSGAPWQYQGRFALHRIHSTWKVVWSPSVIHPALRPGYRLAVVTTTPRRAPLLDAAGRPLARRTLVFIVGVRPNKLRSPHRTAIGLAAATGLDVTEVYGDILAAPSKNFFELATLRPEVYHKLRHQLSRVPGLIIKRARMRLFDSTASSVVGKIGTENSTVLRNNGVPYRPGTTVGLSGLQLAFQRTLVGTPTTNVVAENAAGLKKSVLASWRGHPGKPVQTTIDAATQAAAERAVRSVPISAAIVAIQPSTGKILAVATHKAAHMPAVSALNGRYRPGQAFTIVSTAGLIDDGFSISTHIPCVAKVSVGGRTFTNQPPQLGLGPNPGFSTDFAHSCTTAFAGLSLRLSGTALAAAAKVFGFGSGWRLPVPASASTLRIPSDAAQAASDSVGMGKVTVSPLQMALVAGMVQSGQWRQPSLVTGLGNKGLAPPPAFNPSAAAALRSLMRETVTSGAGSAAAIHGEAISGQVANVSLGPGHDGLRAIWFVGYRGGVAFAVCELTRSNSASAAPVARQFLQSLPAGS